MSKGILKYIENSAIKYPDKIAFCDNNSSISFGDLREKARALGSEIAKFNKRNAPYIVYIDKSVECIIAMFGIVYSGNFYTVIDVNMPESRVESICETLRPAGVITLKPQVVPAALKKLDTLILDDCLCEEDNDVLNRIDDSRTDADALYVLFTSGSTGVPKGAIVTHRNVLTYTDWVCNTFAINEKTVFGSQAPFYFSMSVTDVFSTLKSGATLIILPKSLFAFPVALLKFMKEHNVNTIYWVPSALGIIANWKALDYESVPSLEKVMFAGESMPVKYLNYWMKHFPNVVFSNLFGPTETTDICTYYTVNRMFSDDESLPIGKHCDNCDVFIINDSGSEAAPGEEGELYVRGSFVIPGYYNNLKKTAESFVQNPLNHSYPEIVYKTGDMVKYNDLGELLYIGRKDFQIKRMGYRIELGEIEAAANTIEAIREVCCVYDSDSQKIVLCCECSNELNKEDLKSIISSKVPGYMVPDVIVTVSSIRHNANGKIDRKYIIKNYKEYIKE